MHKGQKGPEAVNLAASNLLLPGRMMGGKQQASTEMDRLRSIV